MSNVLFYCDKSKLVDDWIVFEELIFFQQYVLGLHAYIPFSEQP